jgi:hypothetical protein
LEMTFIRSVVFECLQQENSTFLDLIILQKYLCNLLNIGFWLSLISIGDHFGQISSSLRVDGNHLP